MAAVTVTEPARAIPVLGEWEVVVAGGGPAGIAAAIAAGRAGRRRILVERDGLPGGAGRAAGLSTFCGLHSVVHGRHVRTTRGIADELLGRLQAMEGLNRPHLTVQNRITALSCDISACKIAAEEAVLVRGGKILCHAFAAAILMEGPRRISTLPAGTEESRRAIRGALFVDATGDGDRAARAGAPHEVGDGRGNMRRPATMYRIAGVNPAAAGRASALIPRPEEEREARTGRPFPRKNPIVRPRCHPGAWRAGPTRIRNPDGSAVSGIEAVLLSRGETAGRRQAWESLRVIKAATPGFEEACILEIAPQIGIRETRRIPGRHVRPGTGSSAAQTSPT